MLRNSKPRYKKNVKKENLIRSLSKILHFLGLILTGIALFIFSLYPAGLNLLKNFGSQQL